MSGSWRTSHLHVRIGNLLWHLLIGDGWKSPTWRLRAFEWCKHRKRVKDRKIAVWERERLENRDTDWKPDYARKKLNVLIVLYHSIPLADEAKHPKFETRDCRTIPSRCFRQGIAWKPGNVWMKKCGSHKVKPKIDGSISIKPFLCRFEILPLEAANLPCANSHPVEGFGIPLRNDLNSWCRLWNYSITESSR